MLAGNVSRREEMEEQQLTRQLNRLSRSVLQLISKLLIEGSSTLIWSLDEPLVEHSNNRRRPNRRARREMRIIVLQRSIDPAICSLVNDRRVLAGTSS